MLAPTAVSVKNSLQSDKISTSQKVESCNNNQSIHENHSHFNLPILCNDNPYGLDRAYQAIYDREVYEAIIEEFQMLWLVLDQGGCPDLFIFYYDRLRKRSGMSFSAFRDMWKAWFSFELSKEKAASQAKAEAEGGQDNA